jgi:SAM-dependent methyltransferase
VVDRQFSEPKLANLYDAFCAGRRDFDFYLPLVMSAERVLDVGCGTGELLRLARKAGHTGRLCGLDPAEAMLNVARKRQDIEWVLGDLSSAGWVHEFDLIVMTGHAFQVFLDDDELQVALTAIRSALDEHGRFIFETRNPPFRGWRGGGPSEVSHEGAVVRVSGPPPEVEGERVSFTTVFSSAAWEEPKVSRSTLRFLGRESLSGFLTNAGLAIEAQFGDWDRQPLTETSYEIITVATSVP